MVYLSKVVFPAPKNPDNTVTGSFFGVTTAVIRKLRNASPGSQTVQIRTSKGNVSFISRFEYSSFWCPINFFTKSDSDF